MGNFVFMERQVSAAVRLQIDQVTRVDVGHSNTSLRRLNTNLSVNLRFFYSLLHRELMILLVDVIKERRNNRISGHQQMFQSFLVSQEHVAV